MSSFLNYKDAFKTLKEILGPESYSQAVKDSPDSLRGKYSSLPEVPKEDDLTWIDGATTDADIYKFFPIEETFGLLKPDAEPVWDEIVDEIKAAGFKIASKREMILNPEDIRVLYNAYTDKPYYDDLVRQLTS